MMTLSFVKICFCIPAVFPSCLCPLNLLCGPLAPLPVTVSALVLCILIRYFIDTNVYSEVLPLEIDLRLSPENWLPCSLMTNIFLNNNYFLLLVELDCLVRGLSSLTMYIFFK